MHLPNGVLHPPVEGDALMTVLNVEVTLNPQQDFPAVDSGSRLHQRRHGVATSVAHHLESTPVDCLLWSSYSFSNDAGFTALVIPSLAKLPMA